MTAGGEEADDHPELDDPLGRYRTVVENLPDGAYLYDADLRLVHLNRAAIEGAEVPADRLLGESMSTLLDRRMVGETTTETVMTAAEELASGAREEHRDTLLFKSEGGPSWFEVRSARIETGDGEFAGIVSVLRDATERKRYERRLEEQMGQLEVLNRVLRHDVNNDMAIATGMIEAVRAEIDDPDLESQLDSALESSRHVVELTRTVRDLMRTMAGETEDLEAVDLGRVLEAEVAEVNANGEGSPVRIERPIPGVEVLADDLLGSVFRNLLQNAVRHNEGEPTVVVGAETDGGYARVSVVDDGPGIPDDRKEEVFGKDEKGLESEGTGIGLYLVDSLVTAYGGEVHVTDADDSGETAVDADLGGAAFTVELRTVGEAP